MDMKKTDFCIKRFGFSSPDKGYSSNRKIVFGETMDELLEAVLLLKDPKFTIEFIKTYGYLFSNDGLKRIEEFLIKFNNSFSILEFADYVKNLKEYDLKNIEEYIYSSNEISLFVKIEVAKYASKEYFLKIQDLVMKTNDPYTILDFATSFKEEKNSPDMDLLYHKLLEIGDKRYISRFEIQIFNRTPSFFERFFL